VGEFRVSTEGYPSPEGGTLAAFTASVLATREPRFFVYEFIVPLIFIVLMSWTVFWINVDDFSERQGVAITSMLTIIAYRFALGEHLPQIEYLTRFDVFLFGCTTFVLMSLGEVTVVHRSQTVGKTASARTMDFWWRLAYPGAFVAFAIYAFYCVG
jgi:hypothetical protein